MELLELRHDILLYDIPTANAQAKAEKEGGVLELRYILKNILDVSS